METEDGGDEAETDREKVKGVNSEDHNDGQVKEKEGKKITGKGEDIDVGEGEDMEEMVKEVREGDEEENGQGEGNVSESRVGKGVVGINDKKGEGYGTGREGLEMTDRVETKKGKDNEGLAGQITTEGETCEVGKGERVRDKGETEVRDKGVGENGGEGAEIRMGEVGVREDEVMEMIVEGEVEKEERKRADKDGEEGKELDKIRSCGRDGRENSKGSVSGERGDEKQKTEEDEVLEVKGDKKDGIEEEQGREGKNEGDSRRKRKSDKSEQDVQADTTTKAGIYKDKLATHPHLNDMVLKESLESYSYFREHFKGRLIRAGSSETELLYAANILRDTVPGAVWFIFWGYLLEQLHCGRDRSATTTLASRFTNMVMSNDSKVRKVQEQCDQYHHRVLNKIRTDGLAKAKAKYLVDLGKEDIHENGMSEEMLQKYRKEKRIHRQIAKDTIRLAELRWEEEATMIALVETLRKTKKTKDIGGEEAYLWKCVHRVGNHLSGFSPILKEMMGILSHRVEVGGTFGSEALLELRQLEQVTVYPTIANLIRGNFLMTSDDPAVMALPSIVDNSAHPLLQILNNEGKQDKKGKTLALELASRMMKEGSDERWARVKEDVDRAKLEREISGERSPAAKKLTIDPAGVMAMKENGSIGQRIAKRVEKERLGGDSQRVRGIEEEEELDFTPTDVSHLTNNQEKEAKTNLGERVRWRNNWVKLLGLNPMRFSKTIRSPSMKATTGAFHGFEVERKACLENIEFLTAV